MSVLHLSVLERDEIARGNMTGKSAFRRFGHNPDCGTSWETVWHTGGLNTTLTGAEQLKIVSDDTDDDGDPGGAGARTIFLSGLDTNHSIQSETKTMNGTTAVTTDNSYLRIFKAQVVTAGATGYNEGTILIKNNAADTTLLTIEPQEAESHCAAWTVPAGKTAYITSWRGSESSAKGTDMALWFRDVTENVWQYKRGVYTIDNMFDIKFSIPIVVTEKTDIEVRVKAIIAGAKVSTLFRGWHE